MKNKKKLTLEEQVNSREIKHASRLVWLGYGFLSHLPFFAPKYKVKYNIIDSPKHIKGGAFIIWNHLSRRDYLFIKVMLGQRRFSMVAGYPEFFRSHLAGLFKATRIVPKKPFYSNDVRSLMSMIKLVQKGEIVVFSPEGTSSIFGDNQPIVPGTGSFLKRIGVPVYCCDYRGLYLESNKVDITDKPGKAEITMYKLFSPEDLKNLSGEQIDEKINDTFTHDDYEWNQVKQNTYKGKGNMTSQLCDMLFQCPKCGEMFAIKSENDMVYCTKCGNGMKVDTKYNQTPLIPDAVLPSTPSHWVHWERQNIIKAIRKDDNYEFRMHTVIGGLPKYELLKDHKLHVKEGEGDFVINHEGIHYYGTRNNENVEIHMSYKEVFTPCIEDDLTVLTFFPNGILTDFEVGDRGGYCIILIQEMHRLHVNSWKNLKKFDYMYEDLESPSKIY